MRKYKQLPLFEEMKQSKGAEFSACRKYRYVLWRIWHADLPKILFIGLNPSTADEDQNDPTIRRVISFAQNWGYGGIYMMNLFAYISSKPEVLKTCFDPLKDNDKFLEKYFKQSGDVLFAWGAFKEARQRAVLISTKFPKALCFYKNKDGSPVHPLFVAGKTIPIIYTSNRNE